MKKTAKKKKSSKAVGVRAELRDEAQALGMPTSLLAAIRFWVDRWSWLAIGAARALADKVVATPMGWTRILDGIELGLIVGIELETSGLAAPRAPMAVS